MPRLVTLVLLLMLIGGCAQPRYGLDACPAPGSWSPDSPATVTSLRYRIRTDAGKAAAQEVSRFMERAAALWTPLLGVPAPSALPLEVRLFGNPADLARVLAEQKLPVTATGLYLPAATPMIYVACQGTEPGHPYRTLLHEGTHQFIHLGAGYRAPDQPPASPPRLALPLWLNEGLASYYEAAYLTPDLLQPGRPEPARLAELQRALQHGKSPRLGAVLARRYGDPFSTLDYAVAWGVVYALMQEAPPPWAAGGRAWMQTLIEEARRGWPGTAPSAVPAPAASHEAWWDTATERTSTAFAAFAAEHGLTLADWEARWRAWILAHPAP